MRTSHLLPTIAAALLSLSSTSLAHGGHGDHGIDQEPLADDADWATRHMREEHHINSFDAGVFHKMHDYESTGVWSDDDIRRTYGLFDQSTASVPESKKAEVVRKVLELFDNDRSGTVSYAEYVYGTTKGVALPDFGLGPGHHGDDEYEYEIHHWEKYHGDDTTEEDLTHPEDIAHFAKHEQMEREEAEWEAKIKVGIVEENIPLKFRRQQ